MRTLGAPPGPSSAGTRIASTAAMKIEQLMTREVKTCRPNDSLESAARVMWDFDIGAVPIVDGDGQIIGMLTDRDALMAGFTQGRPLRDLQCHAAMSKHVMTCRPEDSDADVARVMAKNKIRRVPVVDDANRPIGMVSLNDLAIAMTRRKGVQPNDVAQTLAAICEHRPAMPA
jgi:CBS domain-containing protein